MGTGKSCTAYVTRAHAQRLPLLSKKACLVKVVKASSLIQIHSKHSQFPLECNGLILPWNLVDTPNLQLLGTSKISRSTNYVSILRSHKTMLARVSNWWSEYLFMNNLYIYLLIFICGSLKEAVLFPTLLWHHLTPKSTSPTGKICLVPGNIGTKV